VLELGCGSGRVTGWLAGGARRVVALDLCRELLARARARLAGEHVRLIQADLRSLALRARFDLIVAANDPWSHLCRPADRRRALQRVAEHLAPCGRFVLEALWFPPAERPELETRQGRQRTTQLADGLSVHQRWRLQPGSNRCLARYEYRRHGRPLTSASFDGRAWTPAELDTLFAQAGLQLEARWGDFDRRPWDETSSPRLLVVGRGAGEHSVQRTTPREGESRSPVPDSRSPALPLSRSQEAKRSA
jgi:SAM-dependent methyltransferase